MLNLCIGFWLFRIAFDWLVLECNSYYSIYVQKLWENKQDMFSDRNLTNLSLKTEGTQESITPGVL